tara:strand:+ start:891 stop:1562 length:672 start_codon:yes stop_codon:yes gene_type:complete
MSGTIVGEFKRSISLSSSASIQSEAKLEALISSSLSGAGSSSQVGEVTKFGQSHISTIGAFSQGFTKGFSTGSSLVGQHFISQNHLEAKATINAHAENLTFHQASLSASANLTNKLSLFNHRSRFQSTASLTGNSVLLLGGTASLNTTILLDLVISSEIENPDIINITSYIDKSKSFTLYIDKQTSRTLYINKEFSLSAYIDKGKDTTSYIDKIIEKTLVRER